MKRLIAVGLPLLLVATALSLLAYHLFKPTAASPASQTFKKTTTPQPKLPAQLSAGYLVSGDVFWGRGINMFAQQSALKYDWPFSRLNEFHPEQYNGWISDMECPVNNTQIPYSVQVNSLIFACPTAYLPSAAKYFSAFTIANNHTNNTGLQGFLDTRTNLASAGIQFFGHYDLSQINDLCEVITLKANVDNKAAKIPIAMCGYHWLAGTPTDDEIAQITKYAQYFPVWVFPHGGTEYNTGFTPQQQALYHKFIDAGADVVFGDHPHVVEPTEAYKGKLIVYDLGNLIFDQWFDKEVTRNMIVKVKVSAEVDSNLQKYLDLASSCASFKDSCLQTAQSDNLKPYKLNYSYDIVAGDSSNASLNDRAKHLGDQSVQDWLLQRTNWKTTLEGLTTNP